MIDDIHNYFPALLYEPELFETVPQVLSYVRRQIQRTFNPFAYGMRRYESQRILRHNPVANIRVNMNTNSMSALDALLEASILLNQTRTTLPPINFMEPIRIVPSEAQVTSATTIETSQTEGDLCAICQDTIRIADEKRIIRTCNHGFHRSCIDTWFQENVHCPVCRFDIRETV
jgi:hypothetical protein